MVTTSINVEPTQEQVEEVVKEIVEALTLYGLDEIHIDSLKAFTDKNFAKVKVVAATHLDDSFLRSLTYLSSALTTKQASSTPTILAEAARAAADFAKERTLRNLGSKILFALS
jgi:hypothetical protein